MSPEDEFIARLTDDPGADPTRVARQVGISNRLARRLVADLAQQVATRRSRRRVVLAALILGGGGTLFLLTRPKTPTPSPPPKPALSREEKAAERSLYEALDAQDASHTDQALTELSSGKDELRLAALRYLVQVGAGEHTSQLLALLDDPSDRVRAPAIQLVGKLPGSTVDERLSAVAVDDHRALAERLLALSTLEERRVASKDQIARELLPALLSGSEAVRQRTSAVLQALTGKRVQVASSDPKKLHAEWQSVLGVAE
jgi:hypothetical protein